MGDIGDLTAVEQSAAIREGRLTAVEIIEHYLRRIEAFDAELAAFVSVLSDATWRAQSVDQRVASGEVVSRLAGIPIAVKDLVAVGGARTMYGSAAYGRNIAAHDDEICCRVRERDLVMIGKTNVPEFGLSCYTESKVAPPARSPWNMDIGAGGSSGGAAAAVAAGMAPFAVGSDGGGSIRIPAAINGLVGLKPTRGLVPISVHASDPARLSCNGPIARTVADTAALLGALVDKGGRAYRDAIDVKPAKVRIARHLDNIYGVPVDAECRRVWDETTELLIALGHEVVDIVCPMSPEVAESFIAVWCIGASAIEVPVDGEGALMPLTQMLRERGRSYSELERAAFLQHLQDARVNTLARMAEFDAILTPTLAKVPLPIGSIRNDDDPEADLVAQCEFTPFAAPCNVTGQPAMSLPAGMTRDALPVGVQLAGNLNGESLLLGLAAQLEEAIGWPQCKAPFGAPINPNAL